MEIFSGDSSIYSLLITFKEIHLFRINKLMYDSLVGIILALFPTLKEQITISMVSLILPEVYMNSFLKTLIYLREE